jgi:chromate transporter
VAIFLPSFLLVAGTMPYWEELRRRAMANALLRGVNASVVGLLLAAFYNPVWLAGILTKGDFALAVADFVLLFLWKTPPWLVVVISAVAGELLSHAQ